MSETPISLLRGFMVEEKRPAQARREDAERLHPLH
jgi:hypothetical protein